MIATHAERVWCKNPQCNSDYCQLRQTRAALSLAEEGLANYARENAELRRCLDGGVDCAEEKLRLREALREVLEELRLADSRHDLQAKIILAIGPVPQPAEQT